MSEDSVTPASDEAVMRAYRDLFGTKAAWGRAPIVWGFQVGSGWRRIVLRLLDALRAAAAVDGVPVRIMQVKEKFGELRVYVRGGEAARAAIAAAEAEASQTCERCGEPGRLRRGQSYIQVLCDEHGYLPSGSIIKALAMRSELTQVRRSREIAGIVDGWELDVDDGVIILHGVERTSGHPVEEPIVSVDARTVPRAYTAQGWIALGRPDAPVDLIGHLVERANIADDLRDRVLGRRS